MFDLDYTNFKISDGIISGDEILLIQPQLKCEWTADNLQFRSMVIRKSDHRVISRGFNKFFNLGERPDLEPWNMEWPWESYLKKDGSLLIVSRYKDEYILRSRNTISLDHCKNAHEMQDLMVKYKRFFENPFLMSEEYSFLMEWTSPSNIILLKETLHPELFLLGAIHNETGYLFSQATLDEFAEGLQIPRPSKHVFKNFEAAKEMINSWTDKEGVVLYSPDGQILKKVKASHYLRMHNLYSRLGSIKSIVEEFMEMGPSSNWGDLYKYIETKYDFEIADFRESDIKLVVRTYNEILKDRDDVKEYMQNQFPYYSLSKKEQYPLVMQLPSWTGFQKGLMLNYLDGKTDLEITLKDINTQLRKRIKDLEKD